MIGENHLQPVVDHFLPVGKQPFIYQYAGLFFWRNALERRSGTYLKEQHSKKAKIK
jgi:hypothetical protein